MDNTNCKNCESDISSQATACPKCGHPVKQAEQAEQAEQASDDIPPAMFYGGIAITIVCFIFVGIHETNETSPRERPSHNVASKADKSVGYASNILKEKLKSPSSFSLVKGEVMWSGRNSENLPSHVVRLTYDAQNGFGAMLRNCKLVSYSINGDQLEWNTNGVIEDCEIPGISTRADMVDDVKKLNFKA